MPKDMTYEQAVAWFNKHYKGADSRETLVMKALFIEIHRLKTELRALQNNGIDKPPIDG